MGLINIVIGLLAPVAIVGGLLYVVIRRGVQMKRLVEDGVPATGRVVAKLAHTRPGRRVSAVLRIKYAYEDGQGLTHEHVSHVTQSTFNQHVEGGPIAIVYSRSKPSISAPAELVEQSRAALDKRRR